MRGKPARGARSTAAQPELLPEENENDADHSGAANKVTRRFETVLRRDNRGEMSVVRLQPRRETVHLPLDLPLCLNLPFECLHLCFFRLCDDVHVILQALNVLVRLLIDNFHLVQELVDLLGLGLRNLGLGSAVSGRFLAENLWLILWLIRLWLIYLGT